MNKKLFFFTLSSFYIFLISCKRQPVTISENIQAKVESCEVENLDFIYLSSKGKIQYKDKSNEHKTNINIRMKKDSIIWISINAAAGFEAFRILIKTDSIHILDRINNEYIIRDYPNLSQKLGVPLTFSIIQNLIVGNLMIPKEEEDRVTNSDSVYCIFKQFKGNATFTNKVKSGINKIESVEVSDNINSLIINYLKFVPLGSYSFPLENEIILTVKNQSGETETTYINIQHNKTEFPDKELNFPFNIPNKFERK